MGKIQPVDFEKAVEDIINMLHATHDIRETASWYNYNGEEIKHNSILAASFDIHNSVGKDAMKHNRDQGRDLLRIIISKVFQLGYCQAKIEQDNDPLLQIILAGGRDRIEQLEK